MRDLGRIILLGFFYLVFSVGRVSNGGHLITHNMEQAKCCFLLAFSWAGALGRGCGDRIPFVSPPESHGSCLFLKILTANSIDILM